MVGISTTTSFTWSVYTGIIIGGQPTRPTESWASVRAEPLRRSGLPEEDAVSLDWAGRWQEPVFSAGAASTPTRPKDGAALAARQPKAPPPAGAADPGGGAVQMGLGVPGRL